jgi:hypothetical protein
VPELTIVPTELFEAAQRRSSRRSYTKLSVQSTSCLDWYVAGAASFAKIGLGARRALALARIAEPMIEQQNSQAAP